MSNLSNARAQLEEWAAKKPEDYTSKYKDRIDGVMGQLDGMKDFSYDPTRDAATGTTRHQRHPPLHNS